MTTALELDAEREVQLSPSATAMVWMGPRRAHEMVAVPGVRLTVGEVLVRVELATICGSDVHTIEGRRAAPSPLVLGHEHVGRVTHLGAGDIRSADGTPVRVGDRIVWSIFASCGACDRCRSGLSQKCRSLRKYGHERIAAGWDLSGGFATHVHLRAGTAIVHVGERLSAEVLAPLSCGTATAAAALQRADAVRDVDDAVVLVTGAGLIGLTTAAMAADRGATVIVSDPDVARRSLARRFGAAATVDPQDGTDGIRTALSVLGREDVDIVIEASGAGPAVAAGLATVGVGGVIVLVGSVFPAAAIPLDAESIVRRLVTLRGVHNYTADDLVAASRFLRAGHRTYPFVELVGATYPLEDLDAAVLAAAAADHVRVGVRPAHTL